ncbi:hypothetical protein NGB36_16895 [Streptomyces sp. RB6PN25]|uniref:Uncharacterized protein n=1 Tax=Streptomyces humicola TaxID=2953240 RepID=A0ABT1PYN5_9ACTN|nr:hypothetical protein [Streptomyces humicola]MCQ4082238.1 hypothetical protein [Streptomyces humicola]
MQNEPIDMERLGKVLCTIAPEKRINPDTGEVRRDGEGNEQWVVQVSVRRLEWRRSDTIDVVLPHEPRGIAEGAAVRVVNLWANEWTVDGRSGTSYRADDIVPAPAGSSAGSSGAAGSAAASSSSSSGAAAGRGRSASGDA